MKGYWGLPEATAAAIVDGWFATGDIGLVDEDGYFFIVDRKKDMLIRGGYNVYPREIEEVLYGIPRSRRPRSSASTMSSWRRGGRGDRAGRRRDRDRNRAAGLRQLLPPTSIPATSGSSTNCLRARPGRSCAARSPFPQRCGAAMTTETAGPHQSDAEVSERLGGGGGGGGRRRGREKGRGKGRGGGGGGGGGGGEALTPAPGTYVHQR